ncbi:Terpene synthase 5 [Euphorbia peplus]|nr:Terpene synthase 5 [Euphorbia peplus]
MAVSTPTKLGFKVSSDMKFGAKTFLHLPRTIRLPNKLGYHSQKLKKTRANVVDVQKPEEDMSICDSMKNYKHSFWGDTFTSLAPHDSELKSHSIKVEAMKVKVKKMLLNSAKNITDNIEFINLLCRLGVSYHFEDEINEQLNSIFTILPKLLEDNDYELSTLANLFRVLRQYGYKMSSDVFKKFKGIDGEYTEEIANDVKGIICLYEACFLAIPGENILDDALAFTRKHLKILAENSSPHLQDYILKSLMYPSHHTMERLDALNNICFYEEDEFVDETLINFAKLDYNGLQLLYRKELAILSRFTIDAADELPQYMKHLYNLIFEVLENDDTQRCSCKSTFAKEMMKEIERAFCQEATWLRERKAPSFNEYVKVGKVTSGIDILTAGFILGVENMEENAIREEFPKAVDCYMIEHGVSQTEAVDAILNILENEWKRMNEGLLKATTVPRILLKHIFNYARCSDVFCKTSDLFTNYGNAIKPLVTSLIINPLPM